MFFQFCPLFESFCTLFLIYSASNYILIYRQKKSPDCYRTLQTHISVSYTHLDVYKRQKLICETGQLQQLFPVHIRF